MTLLNTFTGVVCSSVVPLPTCPSLLYPQQYKSPFDITAIRVLLDIETLDTLFPDSICPFLISLWEDSSCSTASHSSNILLSSGVFSPCLSVFVISLSFTVFFGRLAAAILFSFSAANAVLVSDVPGTTTAHAITKAVTCFHNCFFTIVCSFQFTFILKSNTVNNSSPNSHPHSSFHIPLLTFHVFALNS